MKIIVFGGAGDMGSLTVEDLASTHGVSRVTIADRNINAARSLSEKLSHKPAKVDYLAVNANDHDNIVKAMSGYDVAASALGPFYLFESKMVRAAIDAGVDYCSICDDWDATENVINEFHDEAREKGVKIINGIGASPGLTNVMVRYLADQLDTIQKAEVYCYLPSDMGGGYGAVKHGVHIMTGDIALFREGKRSLIKSCSEKKLLEFPRFGKKWMWIMGHSEPVTLPGYLSVTEEVNFYMGFGPGSSFLAALARSGLLLKESRVDIIARIVLFLEKIFSGKEPGPGSIRADAWGEKNGNKLHLMACGISTMRESTGFSLSVGTLMLGRQQLIIDKGGVYAPEACYDPILFLKEIKPKGLLAYLDIDMKEPIV